MGQWLRDQLALKLPPDDVIRFNLKEVVREFQG